MAITTAGVAGMLLAYTIFAKLFPLISIWELEEEAEKKEELEATNKLKYTTPS